MPINEYGILDFPENPLNNDLHVDENNVQWRFNGEDWAIFEPYWINDLPDVDTETDAPEVGDILEWDGTHWVTNTSLFALNDLSDVSVNNQVNGNFLVFDGTTWQNIDPIVNDLSSARCGDVYNNTITNKNAEILINLTSVHFETNSSTIDLINDKINIIDDGFYRFDLVCYMDKNSTGNKLEVSVQLFNSVGTLKRKIVTGLREGHTVILSHGQATGFFNLDDGDYAKFYYIDPVTSQNGDVDLTRIRYLWVSIIRESNKI
ncbi:hypothetical protein GQ473_00045 [archaeon]|nr:hypothetical protein [archaeon]